MKILTKIEHIWDAEQDCYVAASAESFEYEGTLALCTGAEVAPAAAGAAKGATEVGGLSAAADTSAALGAGDAAFGASVAGAGAGAMGELGADSALLTGANAAEYGGVGELGAWSGGLNATNTATIDSTLASGGSVADTLSASNANFWANPVNVNNVFNTVGGLNTGAPASSGLWGTVQSSLKDFAPVMSIGSGLYGMSQADAMKKAALLAAQNADSWGNSGGRAAADAQLQEFMRDPATAAAKDPAFALRMQGAMRANAGSGQDSGAMAVAGAGASTDWYNQRLQTLGGLAGAGGTGVGAAQVGLQGQQMANTTLGNSLASIGYGLSGNSSDAQILQLMAKLRASGSL